MDPVPIPELTESVAAAPEPVPHEEVTQILEEAESMALRKTKRKSRKPADPIMKRIDEKQETLSDDDINRIATVLAMKLKEVPEKPPVVEKPMPAKLPPKPVPKPSFNWI